MIIHCYTYFNDYKCINVVNFMQDLKAMSVFSMKNVKDHYFALLHTFALKVVKEIHLVKY